MRKKQLASLGRYEAPDYVKHIKDRFTENFPDSVPKDFVIDHILKYFWEYVEAELVQEREVPVFSLGRFYLVYKQSTRTKHYQYYPKFRFSRHFILRLRKAKGTTTEAEDEAIKKKKDFMESIWEKRKAHMLKTRSKLPSKLENYGTKSNTEQSEQST